MHFDLSSGREASPGSARSGMAQEEERSLHASLSPAEGCESHGRLLRGGGP